MTGANSSFGVTEYFLLGNLDSYRYHHPYHTTTGADRAKMTLIPRRPIKVAVSIMHSVMMAMTNVSKKDIGVSIPTVAIGGLGKQISRP